MEVYLKTVILVNVSQVEDVKGVESNFAGESSVELPEPSFFVVL